MPFQPINFAAIDPLGKPWAANFAKNLQEGMNTYNLPQKLLAEKEQMALANALQRAQVPYAEQNAASNAAILQNTAQYASRMSEAEIKKLEMLGALGGMQFPGGMGLVQGEEAAARIYGRGSKEHQRAIYANDLLLNQRQSSIGRLHSEIDNISDQLNNPYLPEDKRKELQDKQNQLKNKAFNEQSDLDVRQKGLGAKLMEQTWNTFINGPSMNALKKYTGVWGTLKFIKDAAQYNVTGASPDADFDNYLAARNELYTLSDQYTKAFPGSTNYQRMESVQKHVNPESPLMPPNALEASIRSTWKVIEPELKTYTDVLHGKNPLREGGAHNETIEELNKKTLKQQQDQARKATGTKPKKNIAPPGENWFWDGSKFVKGGFPK
jgi:hypothetical protein